MAPSQQPADNSGLFHKLTKVFYDVEREPSLTLKTDIIRKYLENEKCDTFLAMNFLLCKEDLRVYRLNDKKLVRIGSEAFGCSLEEMTDHLDEGDVSETMAQFLEDSENAAHRPTVTLKQVDQFLNKLTKITKEEAQVRALESVACQKLTRYEMLWLTRLIKKDLRIGAGGKTVLNALHDDAYDVWKNTADLKYVVDKVLGNETETTPTVVNSTMEVLGEFDLSDSDGDDDDRMTSAEKLEAREETVVTTTTDNGTTTTTTTTTTTSTVTTSAGTATITTMDEEEDVVQENSNKRKLSTQPNNPRAGKKAKLSAQIRLGKPVKPQLAKAVKSFEEVVKKYPEGFYADWKLDGERIQIHKDGEDFQYWSRNLKPVTEYKIKDVKKYIEEATTAKQVILDGEITMVSTTTGEALPFGALGKHKRQQYGNEDECVVAIFLFDILYLEGKSLLHIPLKKRRRLLKRIIKPIEHRIIIVDTQLIDGPMDERQDLLEERMMHMIAHNYEGLVIKSVDSPYEPKARKWLKMKKMNLQDMADTVDCCVVGAYYGTGRMGGLMAVFLMAVRKPSDDSYWTVCKVGNGFSDDELQELTDYFEPKMRKIQKDHSALPDWIHCDRMHTPDFVLKDPKDTKIFEVAGAEFSESPHYPLSISIRFPHVIRIRGDKTLQTMTTVEQLKELNEESKKGSSVSAVRAKSKSAAKNNSKKRPKREPPVRRNRRQEEEEEEQEEENEEDRAFINDGDIEEEEEEEYVDPNAPPSGFIWQFYDGVFKNYDVDASESVEEVYQDWRSNPGNFDVRAVKSGFFEYMIDFRNMTQTNITHNNHTVRRIRRVKWEG